MRRVSTVGTATADAAGECVVTLNAPPTTFSDVHTITIVSNSSGGMAVVSAGSFLLGFILDVQQGWGRGALTGPGERLTLAFSGMVAGDVVTVYDAADRYAESEELPPSSFEGAPVSSIAVDSLFAFQETTGSTQIIAAPTSPAFIRVLSCTAGVSRNVASAGGNVPLIRLVDNVGAVIVEMLRFNAPAASSTEGGFDSSPQVSFGRGRDVAAGRSLSVETTFALTGGRAYAQVEYVIVGG